MLTASYLEELLVDAGFSRIMQSHSRGPTQVGELITGDMLNFEDVGEDRHAPQTLVFEGAKNASEYTAKSRPGRAPVSTYAYRIAKE
jgi:hypothetical protein